MSSDLVELLALLEEQKRRERYNAIQRYFPDTGPLRRELYGKHMEAFRAGLHHRERLVCAANRIGKSETIGGFETTLHLTGIYPGWWPGRKFNKPIRAWAAGDTGKTVRDIIQLKLLGPYYDMGSGLIPKDALVSKPAAKAGIADAVDTVRVRHVSGGESLLVLKSYDQRRESFQGTEQDFIWMDEEPPLEVYVESVLRTMTNNGMVLTTFTPLTGVSDMVLSFMPDGNMPINQITL